MSQSDENLVESASRPDSAGSIGIVLPRVIEFDEPLSLVCGRTLPSFELMIETYGELNASRSNAVLICHALSGHHHAAGFHDEQDKKPGWWDVAIGPGKPIDTDRFFVVSLNNLGGCHGSTGPCSRDPNTGAIYGPDFPTVTVDDWVESQARLADRLGIARWAAVVGGSLGGMQALQWAITFPDRVQSAVVIAAATRLSAQNIAFNEIARHAIQSDPQFHAGRYQAAGSNPEQGLMLARMVGHVTYQSDDGLRSKFGREVKSGDIAAATDVQFQVESYLHYQGRGFSKNFDANTYILMTRALDYFDPARNYNDDLIQAFSRISATIFVAAFTTDWRFAPSRSREIVDALINARRNVVYTEIKSPNGHDAFLLPEPRYMKVLSAFMNRAYAESFG